MRTHVYHWLLKKLRGTSVETTQCACMTGLGQSCSHIGALLFKLEATVRAGFTKKACTDVACTWNQDFFKKIKPDEIVNIKIYSEKAIDNSKKSEPKTISFSGTNAKPKNENIDLFLSRLSTLECKLVILHSYSKHCDTFIPKFKPPERARLANMIRSYYSSMHKEKIKVKCNEKFLKLEIKQQDTDKVESLTRKQSNCLIWHHVRCG